MYMRQHMGIDRHTVIQKDILGCMRKEVGMDRYTEQQKDILGIRAPERCTRVSEATERYTSVYATTHGYG